jgi:hypothetical protein
VNLEGLWCIPSCPKRVTQAHLRRQKIDGFMVPQGMIGFLGTFKRAHTLVALEDMIEKRYAGWWEVEL